MGSQKEKKLADILAGALIGLARATYSHLKTENTDRVITGALSVLAILEQVRAEKLAVAPGCADCVAKCGNTDDYDMDRFWNGPDQVRALKIRLFSGLKKAGRKVFKAINEGKAGAACFQELMPILYKGLFILAEDWEPEEIYPVIEELDEAEGNCYLID